MDALGELLASDHRQTLEFFVTGLKDVSEPNFDREELLYNASVLAHYAQRSSGPETDGDTPATLSAVFDQFVGVATHLTDPSQLETAGAQFERITVPGALEIPPVISFAARVGEEDAEPFDGYVALGCVIRDDGMNFDIVAHESARGLMALALEQHLCIGNGILSVESEDQGLRHAARDQLDMGGEAARACLALINVRAKLWSRG